MAGDVQREPLRGVKTPVSGGRQVVDTVNVRGPGYALRILRPGYSKTAFFPLARGFQQQFLNRRLPILAVSAHVAEVVFDGAEVRGVQIRIDRAVERSTLCARYERLSRTVADRR